MASNENKKEVRRSGSNSGGGRNSSGNENGNQPQPTHDPDLFSILSSMHLTNQISSQASNNAQIMAALPHPIVVASRKRKILDGGGHEGYSTGGTKMNGTRHRRNSDENEELPLQTPQCSQSGYADEEDKQHHAAEAAEAAAAAAIHQKNKRSGFMSPEIQDIDDNLAADFDGSLSGLGMELHTASFSMNEALNALPNLSISSSQIFKQEIPSPAHHVSSKDYCELKNEPSNGSDKKSYGALDLSNDEAYLPESNECTQGHDSQGQGTGPITSFAGSVSREATPSITFAHQINKFKHNSGGGGGSGDARNNVLSASNPNLSQASSPGNTMTTDSSLLHKSKKIILPLNNQDSPSLISQDCMKLEKRSYETIAISELDVPSTSKAVAGGNNGGGGENFQYILAASTSIATKINEPSITYLNQGQAYELRLKKSGDLSPYRKRHLKCVLRICFHERRLQYMEAEQIAEWSSKHPGERIIDVDLPLSYGVFDAYRDPRNINCLSFKWDPTRDTGIFIKVNCISTEFTPKKHGGEKGVPFRLQVETYDNESRIHAAGCILQVFKLKGADRKHKQDRDKISKRPLAEQEKFAPPFESTVLTDLALEHIYVPANLSRPSSPIAEVTPPSTMGLPEKAGSEEAPEVYYDGKPLEHSSTQAQVASWLVGNRFSNFLPAFRNFDGRDMLRLSREETITICGPGDGIRLYNQLHVVPVPPKTVVYVGSKEGDNEFSALYLEELTVAEFLRKLTEAFGIDLGLFTRMFLVGPKGIYIHFTDSVVRHMKAETVFQFSLRASSNEHKGLDVVLEEMSHLESSRGYSGSPANSNNSN